LDNVFVLFALGLFFAVGSVLEVEMARTRRETPAALRNFFDMWREDGELIVMMMIVIMMIVMMMMMMIMVIDDDNGDNNNNNNGDDDD